MSPRRRVAALRRTGLAVALVALALPACASESVTDWLMKMNDAASALSYRGTFVYLHDNQLETMRVARRAGPAGVRERLFSLNGAAREIIRDEKRVWCYLPDQRMGVHQYRQSSDNTFPRILPRDIGELTDNYLIDKGRRERIADRDSQEIRVRPRDDFRYGYELWVDEQTGLLLRADLVDPGGTSLEKYMFTEVSIGGVVSDRDLAPRTPRKDLVWFGEPDEEAAPVPGELEWTADRVPEGFMLSRHIRRMSAMRKQPVEHLVYSDGLAAVSVFVEDKRSLTQTPMQGLSRMGAVHAFGTMVGDYQVTVVGEVPGKTVDMIGMSVRRRQGAAD